MKLNIANLLRNFLLLAFVLVAGYVSFLYYKPSSEKVVDLQIQEKNKEENKVEIMASSNNPAININSTAEGLAAKELTNSETINVDDYLKIIKTLSNITHNIYQDRDFVGELSVLRNFAFLGKFEKDFEYLENYRVKFLLNANKNELIFPNENLSFLSELIKIEKLDSNKIKKEESFKNSILILRKIEDEILSKDFIKNLSDLVK
jgi:hypothetical protein